MTTAIRFLITQEPSCVVERKLGQVSTNYNYNRQLQLQQLLQLQLHEAIMGPLVTQRSEYLCAVKAFIAKMFVREIALLM